MKVRMSGWMSRIWLSAVVVPLIALVPLLSRAQDGPHPGIVITLKNDFIQRYKNRATIDTMYTVDKAHPRPNAPSKDGDMHIAGRAPEVKLPIVAEIMNARFQTPFVNRIHDVEGTDQAIPLSGVWRLWCEHAGTAQQIQGQSLKPFTTTNPDHVFEIHPITSIDKKSLIEKSLKPIQGFATKDAHDAFVNYDGLPCKIIPGHDTTTLITRMGGYNYVEFLIEPDSDPKEMDDGGTAILCMVRDLEGELLVRRSRMIFVKGSEPQQKLKELKPTKRLHVLGIPRIDLALVEWRVAHKDDERNPLTWNLPYEMAVVAVYPSDEGNN